MTVYYYKAMTCNLTITNMFFPFFSGGQFVQIVDFSDVVQPKVVKQIPTEGPVADIAECGDLVAFTQPGKPHFTDVGSLKIYEKYNPATMMMKELCSVEGRKQNYDRFIDISFLCSLFHLYIGYR